MKRLIFILLVMMTYVHADVFMVDDEVILYSVPEGLLKKPSINDDVLAYFDQKKNVRMVFQLFRKKQWADWHMRGLIKSKKTFQKYFDTELGGANGELLNNLEYDEQKFELTLWWTQSNGEMLMSRMKLTSFGCVAVHIPYLLPDARKAETLLAEISSSIVIPENLQFKPKAMVDDIMSNIGGGFFFLVISLVYLMFSLFKRSQLHHMKLERRMHEVKTAQLQKRAN